jgi:hypothetical protein
MLAYEQLLKKRASQKNPKGSKPKRMASFHFLKHPHTLIAPYLNHPQKQFRVLEPGNRNILGNGK